VGSIGYAKLPADLIFEGFGVLFDKTIVLAMEMNREKIEKAPSQETFEMIHETYDELGIAANRIVGFLRERGFAAHAGHPLGGLTLYPPLAQMAGIGWIGKHGLLITPEFGPRVRLAAVYTNIENLPFSEANPHEWIEEYCEKCGLCMKMCPADAIYQNPKVDENGHETHIQTNLCFEYFAENYGCSVCIKVCPFSKVPYAKLKGNVQGATS
jgi:epoxyqueuosine reductase QueG